MHSAARFVLGTALLMVSLGPASRASADPIVVTSGYIVARSWDEFQAHVKSPVFELLVQSTRSGFTELVYGPGDPIDLSTRILLDDVELHRAFEGTGRIDFTLTGRTDRLPTGPVPTTAGSWNDVVFTTPFSFIGQVVGSNAAGETFTAELIGRGHARFVLLGAEANPPYWDRDVYVLRDTNFYFEEAAPVPEPASLLLIGAALAGMVSSRARKRFRRRDCRPVG